MMEKQNGKICRTLDNNSLIKYEKQLLRCCIQTQQKRHVSCLKSQKIGQNDYCGKERMCTQTLQYLHKSIIISFDLYDGSLLLRAKKECQ